MTHDFWFVVYTLKWLDSMFLAEDIVQPRGESKKTITFQAGGFWNHEQWSKTEIRESSNIDDVHNHSFINLCAATAADFASHPITVMRMRSIHMTSNSHEDCSTHCSPTKHAKNYRSLTRCRSCYWCWSGSWLALSMQPNAATRRWGIHDRTLL